VDFAATRFNSDAVLRSAVEQYGTPQTFMDRLSAYSTEQLRDLQLARLKSELERASHVPFFARLWESASFDPASVMSLEDVPRIPAYTVYDIRDSIDRDPPYGDYQGVRPGPDTTGLRIFFSGGTTGRARPTVYTAWDRIVGSSLIARAYHMHGIRQGDVVLNAWSFSTHNAAWIFDQALYEWIGATPITVGTGNVTSSAKQLEIASMYGASTILATADYLLHLRGVAADMGLKGSDFAFTGFDSVTGDKKAAVTEAWGAPAYDHYGFHEVHSLSAECPVGGGLHIWDDAFVVDIVDPETGEPLPDGQVGDLVVTCLYKTGSPQVRFNIKDLASIIPEPCPCGSPLRRMTSMAGRSDTMVKLRGINIWPEAIGDVTGQALGRSVEYHCVSFRSRGQDQMVTLVEATNSELSPEVATAAAQKLRDRLNVKVDVALVPQGSLTPLTGLGETAKAKRFTDCRTTDALPAEVTELLGRSVQASTN